MASRQNTTTALDENARKALAVLEEEGGALSATREQMLLDGASAAEVSKLDKQIEVNRHAAATEKDRIALFEKKLAEEEREAVARRHEEHCREFERMLAAADGCADELQAAIAIVEQTFCKTIELRELALSMWPFGKSSHADAAARAPEGCAMSAGAIAALVANEIHRISFVAPLGGRAGEKVKVSLPGGRPERLTPLVDPRTKQLVPLVPLSEKLRTASKFAVSMLRDNAFVPPVAPQPPVPIQVLGVEQPAPAPVPAPAQAAASVPAPSAGNTLQEFVPVAYREKLSALLRQQMQAAASGDDAAYERCVAATAALRLEIDAARNGEAAA
jgi:hypothetical protein